MKKKNKSQHTKGNWNVNLTKDMRPVLAIFCNGLQIATMERLVNEEEEKANAWRIVKAVNMYDELIELTKTTKAFFDTMPKGQFGKISCDVGLMNDMFSGIAKILKQADQH